MTVLFISHEHDKLMGSTLSLANMIHALKMQGCEAITVLPEEGIAKDFFCKQGVRCIVARFHVDFVGIRTAFMRILSFPYRLLRDYIDHRKAIESIISQLQGIHIDIVHTNTAVIDIGPALAKRLEVPHVWHLREFINLDMGFKPFLGWKHLKNKIRMSDATISITQAIAKHYGLMNDGNTSKHYILFDAIRTKKSIKRNENKLPQMVFLGQLAPHKGPDMAIRAFCLFAQGHPEYRLLLIGTPIEEDYVQKLKEMVPESVKNQVFFMGYVNHPDEILAQSTSLLMCSQNEAQGRVTIEAMLLGCPVIGLDKGGTREIIRHGKTGWLFNDEQQLLSSMEEVVSNPIKAKEIVNEAICFAERHFIEENYGPKILDIYQSICQN